MQSRKCHGLFMHILETIKMINSRRKSDQSMRTMHDRFESSLPRSLSISVTEFYLFWNRSLKYYIDYSGEHLGFFEHPNHLASYV